MKSGPENNVDSYIASAPEEARAALRGLRALIRQAVPGATERTDYFQMPGYSYGRHQYYDGMFAWFSFKKPFVRLHVLPSVIEKHGKELVGYRLAKSIISFKIGERVPRLLVKKMAKESRDAMKALGEAAKK